LKVVVQERVGVEVVKPRHELAAPRCPGTLARSGPGAAQWT
jgi:hypothetical protein